MVVGGEERFGAQFRMVVDIFDDGPGNGQPVIGAGPAPDLVQHQQAATGGMVEDVGRLDHLDHEGGLAAVDLVATRRCA